MKLEGIHHITAITGDAPGNVDFYARVLGPAPGEEVREPGRPDRLPPVLRRRARQRRRGHHLLRVPGRPPRPRGPGWCTPSSGASRRRARRLLGGAPGRRGRRGRRDGGRLHVLRPGGARPRDPARRDRRTSRSSPVHPEIPRRARDPGLRRRARLHRRRRREPRVPRRHARLRRARASGVRGPRRPARRRSTPTTRSPATGWPGAGTVHHVAWSSPPEEHEAWRERVARGRRRGRPTSSTATTSSSIYFREPSGVLFEIATIGPGFATDEDIEHLGERLALPPELRAPARAGREGRDAAPDPRADWAVR